MIATRRYNVKPSDHRRNLGGGGANAPLILFLKNKKSYSGHSDTMSSCNAEGLDAGLQLLQQRTKFPWGSQDSLEKYHWMFPVASDKPFRQSVTH